jgi:transglutaminase-like putative cysteine protease
MEAILLMTAIKMLEKKESRDYVQIAALSLAAVVAYAMLSAEKTFILYCFGTTLLCSLSLILSAWFSREPQARLALRELRQVCLRSLSLFGLMLPLSLLLFYILPRTATPLFGMRGQFGLAATGFSDQVQLGDASAIQNNNRLAFRAVMPPVPESRTPYWRGLVLDFFDGRGWIAGRGRRSRDPFVPERGAPRIEQQIFLEPGNRGVLFALDQPVGVSGVEADDRGSGMYQYQSRNVGRRLQYEATSVLSSQMRPLHANFDRSRTLALPPNFIPRLRLVVADLTRGMSGDREKAEAVMRYLASPAFTYSLEGLPADPRNALEQFLFDTRRGNCEYFASAMGVMLRMTDVPSRMVSGYRGGIYNDVGGYYIVQEERAHIWVEAWDGAIGAWVRWDPTPAGDLGLTDALSALEFYLDMMDYQWSKLVVNYNWEVQSDLMQGLREVLRNPRASLTPTGDGMRRLGSALSVPATLLAALVACGSLFYLLRQLRDRRPEIVLLRRFQRGMKRHGYARHESEGLEEFLARVDDEELRNLALPFVRRFEDIYYGGATPDSAAQKTMRLRIEDITRYKKRTPPAP